MVEQALATTAIRDGPQQKRSEVLTHDFPRDDYERLRQQLLADLLTSEQWMESIKEGLKQYEGSVADLTYQELLSTITPHAKLAIQAETREKMLGLIQAALQKQTHSLEI